MVINDKKQEPKQYYTYRIEKQQKNPHKTAITIKYHGSKENGK